MKIVDMHCDTISRIFYSNKNGDLQHLHQNHLHIDIEKMRKSGYMLQNFAMFTQLSMVENPFEHVMKLIDLFYQEIDENKEYIAVAKTYDDILKNEKAGKMSALLTMEEGACCKGSVEFLRILYRLGVRMGTLTWNFPNELGYPNMASNGAEQEAFDGSKGLTEKGIEFVSKMEQLGMIIDVSHLSDQGFYDVANYTTKPFVASHSNARSICGHRRNLTDDMIRVLGERGGVTGLNYYGAFLEDGQDYDTCVSRLSAMARHARHITNIGGMECLGLGSDFDGISGILEMEDCSKLDLLEKELRTAGFQQSEIEGIFYGNVMRVYKEILR